MNADPLGCGTPNGPNRHRAAGTPVCADCREARRLYARDRRMRLTSLRAFTIPIEMAPEMADFDGIGACIARGLRELA